VPAAVRAAVGAAACRIMWARMARVFTVRRHNTCHVSHATPGHARVAPAAGQALRVRRAMPAQRASKPQKRKAGGVEGAGVVMVLAVTGALRSEKRHGAAARNMLWQWR